jgi:hypothetical protein
MLAGPALLLLALDLMQKLMLHLAVSQMLTEFQIFLMETHGQDWAAQLHGRKIAAQRRFPQKRKHTWGTDTNKESDIELVKDIIAGVDAISCFADSDWWAWNQGSALFFWR